MYTLLPWIQEHSEKIYWSALSQNPHPGALQWLRLNPEEIHWHRLSQNSHPDALKLLRLNPENIDWCWLSRNSNPDALALMQEHFINAKESAKDDNIEWCWLSANPNIFTYNYEAMKQSHMDLKQELMETMFHPKNIPKFSSWGYNRNLKIVEDI